MGFEGILVVTRGGVAAARTISEDNDGGSSFEILQRDLNFT